MKTMYRVGPHASRVDTHEIVKESDSSVWFKNKEGETIRECKRSIQSFNWFEKIEEAKSFLLKRVLHELECAKTRLERATLQYNSTMENLK